MTDSEFLALPKRGNPSQSAAAGCSFGSRRESMKRTWERFILFGLLALGLVLLGYGVLLELGLA